MGYNFLQSVVNETTSSICSNKIFFSLASKIQNWPTPNKQQTRSVDYQIVQFWDHVTVIPGYHDIEHFFSRLSSVQLLLTLQKVFYGSSIYNHRRHVHGLMSQFAKALWHHCLISFSVPCDISWNYTVTPDDISNGSLDFNSRYDNGISQKKI